MTEATHVALLKGCYHEIIIHEKSNVSDNSFISFQCKCLPFHMIILNNFTRLILQKQTICKALN
jgi:carbonic anhydrase/acetyltransferase-like protein (isoleucine patch superfamily)